jgi:hypothetical protein
LKKHVFFLVVIALLCFAMPAIASPPLDLPALEAIGPAIGMYQATPVALEVAPVAIDTGGPILAVNYFETVRTRESSLFLNTSQGTAPTLADFKTLPFSFYASRIAAGYCVSANGIERVNMGARRWV